MKEAGVVPRIVNAILGAWLIIAPFVLGYSGFERGNSIIVGLIACTAALIATKSPTVRYVNTAIGGWLLFSTWFIQTSLGALINQSLIGLWMIAVSVQPPFTWREGHDLTPRIT